VMKFLRCDDYWIRKTRIYKVSMSRKHVICHLTFCEDEDSKKDAVDKWCDFADKRPSYTYWPKYWSVMSEKQEEQLLEFLAKREETENKLLEEYETRTAKLRAALPNVELINEFEDLCGYDKREAFRTEHPEIQVYEDFKLEANKFKKERWSRQQSYEAKLQDIDVVYRIKLYTEEPGDEENRQVTYEYGDWGSREEIEAQITALAEEL